MLHFLRHVPRIEARAALTSFSAAILLLLLKFVAYFLTNSSAIFSDALESIANVAAAGFALYALHMAHRPADSDHPYGHGKIEFLSAGFEGSMILTAALVAVLRACDALLHRADIHTEYLGVGLALLAVALLVNGSVGFTLARVGRHVGSAALLADGRHLMSDAITSVAAIAGLVVVRLTRWNYADPIAALLVAAYIGFMGLKLMRVAVGGLMDEQDESDDKLLKSILDAHLGPQGAEPRVCSYHKLRHRHSGRYHWVDFHVMVPPKWDVQRAHDVASAIEYEIERAIGTGNATAHIEPCDTLNCDLCETSASAPSPAV
ncbi:MAG TPA: cation diffusion facilitator family transporter [Tepidisphaeraceae bacterium]|jgi:cation diffusion facilitator family transporter|nr:cation diffusion facilitator family transporter [Tepidisphaeraceae bacterium]